MKDSQNVTIAILCVSAAVLGALLAFTTNTGRTYADVSAGAGDYVMFTAEITDSSDLLYIIDRTTRRMNAYQFKALENTINLVDQVDLAKAFRSPGKRR